MSREPKRNVRNKDATTTKKGKGVDSRPMKTEMQSETQLRSITNVWLQNSERCYQTKGIFFNFKSRTGRKKNTLFRNFIARKYSCEFRHTMNCSPVLKTHCICGKSGVIVHEMKVDLIVQYAPQIHLTYLNIIYRFSSKDQCFSD